MMTLFFENDMAFGTTDDIIIIQLASLYHTLSGLSVPAQYDMNFEIK